MAKKLTCLVNKGGFDILKPNEESTNIGLIISEGEKKLYACNISLPESYYKDMKKAFDFNPFEQINELPKLLDRLCMPSTMNVELRAFIIQLEDKQTELKIEWLIMKKTEIKNHIKMLRTELKDLEYRL